jgi:hypothetical protein
MRILHAVIIAVMLFLSCSAYAGETSISVPVSINYTGGCVITTPPHDMGSMQATIPGAGLAAPSYTMSFTCSFGTGYTVSQINFVNLANSNAKTIKATLYKDPGYANAIGSSTPTIATGTGTGSLQTITTYPKIFGYNTGNGACTYTAPNYYCPEDTYSATYTFRIAF